MHAVDGAVGSVGRQAAQVGPADGAETQLLAFQVAQLLIHRQAATAGTATCGVRLLSLPNRSARVARPCLQSRPAACRQRRVRLERVIVDGPADLATKSTSITPKITAAWRKLLEHPAEHDQRSHGQQDDAHALRNCCKALGFSNGWALLAPKKPPPLVPNCLMATMRRHWAAGDLLLAAGRRRHCPSRPVRLVDLALPCEGHRHAAGHEQHGRRPGTAARRSRPSRATGRRRSCPGACRRAGRG